MDFTNESLPANITAGVGDQNKTVIKCFMESTNWTVFVIPPYIIVITVLGFILNIFVLMVVCLHKKSRTIPEIYMSALAAADLLLVSFLPFWAANIYNHFNWTFGLAMCKLVNVSILMNAYCSIYLMVLISMDRYLALVHPLLYKEKKKTKFAKLGCMVVWILGFLLSLPAVIYRDLTPPNNSNTTRCFVNYPSHTKKLTSEVLISVFGFIVPIFILSFCTVTIIKSLIKRKKETKKLKNIDYKAITLLLAVLLAFLICWLPFHLMKLLYLLVYQKILTSCNFVKLLTVCSQIFNYLAFFNSVLNPILYVLVGKTYQTNIVEFFTQQNHKRISSFQNTNSFRSSTKGRAEDVSESQERTTSSLA